jgi:hypothetical protein
MEFTASVETLFKQATMTATDYMVQAVDQIDKTFGEGYAAKHPELVGAFMRTAAADFHTAIIAKIHSEGQK